MNGRPHGACRPHLPIPGYRVVAYLSRSGRQWRLRPRRGQSRAHSLRGQRAYQAPGTDSRRQPAQPHHPPPELTQAGETLYAYARNIVELEREARARLHGTPIRDRLRIGASEDFASAWLPRVLQRFRRWHPEASIELKVGITTDLLRQQAQGRTDVVFGKQCRRVGDDGELLWEEPLVWAAATAIELPVGEPLPLALFPEPCVYREAAITALGAAARPWRLVFESASMAGCLSAALAGFAVTVVARSQMREGCANWARNRVFRRCRRRVSTPSRQPSLAVDALIEAVRQLGQRSRFVTAQG